VIKDARGVLVVDDDADIRAFVSELLVDEGYEVRAAPNGRDALAILANWRPDVILLDLMMPEMDGWAFLARQRLNLELVRIPVIVISASYNLQGGAGRIPAADVVAKPFAIDQLLAKVEVLAS
jgi:two-component system, sensor histidine kinase and response regulator